MVGVRIPNTQSANLPRVRDRDREAIMAEWHDGICSRCDRESRVTSIDHDEFAEVCLVCADLLAESGETEAAATAGDVEDSER